MGLQTPASGRKSVGKAQGMAGCHDPIRENRHILSLRHSHRGYRRLYQDLTDPRLRRVSLAANGGAAT